MSVNTASTDNQLKDFFLRELSALREDAAVFAQSHPQAAQALALNRGRSHDPHVEMLIQSFAYLTGRLQYQLEINQAALPGALLSILYPHLEAPLPSMLIARADVRPDNASFAKGVTLARHRHVQTTANDSAGRKLTCRFRTGYDTPLWPLTVAEVKTAAPNEYAFIKNDGKIRSMLRVRIDKLCHDTFKTLGVKTLRFYINSEEKNAFKLYEILATNVLGILALPTERSDNAQSKLLPPLLPATALHWMGFDEKDAILPVKPNTHPGYRLLQEYFVFPEKFLFFEVGGLQLDDMADSFDLVFLLDTPPPKGLSFTAKSLELNCLPLVNLYTQRIDPLTLDHTQYEYRLQGDIQNHHYCEIYAVEQLTAIRPGAAPRPLMPYFAMDYFRHLEKQDYFYALRREVNQLGAVPGTELYVSFLDTNFDITQCPDEVIGGVALCTNRKLPEQLRVGDRLELEGAGPLSGMHVLNKPSGHQTPPLTGDRPWALASQLALNHLSLADGPEALGALKEMLRLHVGPASMQGLKQIDGLRALSCRPMTRLSVENGRRGFMQGLHIHLEIDRSHFGEASAVLFTEILRRFFALYASVNTLVEVSLETNDVKGVLKQWQPLVGAQTVL